MVRKFYKEIVSANIISVTLEHNGYQNGDASHGGFVKIIIENMVSTCMSVNGEKTDKFELLIRGDSERSTFAEAFNFIANELYENQKVSEDYYEEDRF
ncbi:hypothetical protein MEO93_20880 [Dolichospermum sp. ST_sed3]|nr:hypothetical protein [Dolichospermum sp. ST_sed3]